MGTHTVEIFYDFIDPLSWLLARELEAAIGPAAPVRWIPLELRPPPTPLTTLTDPELAARWAEAADLRGDEHPPFAPPRLVPWTRKAHELLAHADEHGAADAVRRAVFQAYLFDGRDVGRVDVLVDIAREAGLDPSETKAVLDVDRHEAAVARLRSEALASGVSVVPTLRRGDRRLEGFHNGAAVRTFLGT